MGAASFYIPMFREDSKENAKKSIFCFVSARDRLFSIQKVYRKWGRKWGRLSWILVGSILWCLSFKNYDLCSFLALFFYLELQFTTEGSRPHFRPHFLVVSSLKKALPNLSIAQTIMFKRFELHTLASKEEQCAEIHENQPPQRFQTTPKIIWDAKKCFIFGILFTTS